MKAAFTRMHIIMVAATTLLGGSITFGWLASRKDEAPSLQPAERAAPLAVPNMPTQKLASGFEAIVKRPLFSQTRRPSPPPEPAPPPISASQEPPAAPLAATLIGIVISPDMRSAVLRMADGKNVAVAEGDSVDGWKLSEVMPDAARFKHVATTIELSFPVPQPPANPTRSSGPPAPLVRRR
jgi:hypothetical protein